MWGWLRPRARGIFWTGPALCLAVLLIPILLAARPAATAAAQAPVRGLIPRARQPVVVDGRLDEWIGAFATPVNFGHADWQDRAAVWHYLWDDQNLYIGLECLDTALFNRAPGPIYDGDGVEFYLDVRPPAELGQPGFTPGTLHLFYTAASNGEIRPRIQVRGGIPGFAGTTAEGMEAAAARTAQGYALEFRLPWSKFPGFKPEASREIGIDCELCSSDGVARVDRCWVYSGVAAVAGPAAFGRVRLVDAWNPEEAAAYSDVLFPSFLARGTPLGEPATLFLGISPALQPHVRGVEFSAGGRRLPFGLVKRFGPGWARAQCCLVGFTRPEDEAVVVRFLGEGGRVLGERSIPLRQAGGASSRLEERPAPPRRARVACYIRAVPGFCSAAGAIEGASGSRPVFFWNVALPLSSISLPRSVTSATWCAYPVALFFRWRDFFSTKSLAWCV